MIYFITSNDGKFKEAKLFLRENYNIEIERIKGIEVPEIQSDKLEEIAEFSLDFLLQKNKAPQFVEDAGLFIEMLNGFPGPYSSYVYRTIGNQGILNLLKPIRGSNEVKAYFKAVIAYYDFKNNKKVLFEGISRGLISDKIKGDKGWGFDPIFIPIKGNGMTFAEMGIENKNKYSHRIDALKKLGNYVKKFGV
ncbi:MAG: XTP/dITP diphosphatase [Candidatus Helarchaeota archaeon]